MHTSIWTATSPEALQAQLEKALFVVHLFGGAVFMHVLVTLRDVEWRISQGRIACRWSLFNSAGCRILPLLSVTTTMGWLTSLDLGNTRSILFNISQTTELVTEIFSFMIITLGTASVWNSRQVTYIVETAFLALAGVIFSTMGDSSINGVAHISSMRLALMLGRLIFSGFLLGVAFFGMLNRRVQSVKEGLPPTRMKALCATLRDEGLHLYIVVFLAQIAPVVVYAMNIDPSGLLRLVVEYTSYVTLTLTASIIFRRMVQSTNGCPVTQYCIVIGLALHVASLSLAAHGLLAKGADQSELSVKQSRCPCPHLTQQSSASTEESIAEAHARAGVRIVTKEIDLASTSSQCASSSEGSRQKEETISPV